MAQDKIQMSLQADLQRVEQVKMGKMGPSAHDGAKKFNRLMLSEFLKQLLKVEEKDMPEEASPFSKNSEEQRIFNFFLVNSMADALAERGEKGLDIAYSSALRQLQKAQGIKDNGPADMVEN